MRENEEFRLVTRRKKRGSSVRSSRDNNVAFVADEDDNDDDVDSEAIFRKLHNTEAEFRNSSFADNVFDALTESLNALNVDSISEILCYGLGCFTRRRSSKYQLALLLSLKRQYGSRAHIYDPVFLPTEIELLKRFDFKVIEANEEGKRVVNDKVTLVYMPHCCTHLVNNFLYANWGRKLNNCILLTNSFTTIADNPLRRNPSAYVDYVSRVRPHVTEITLRNDFTYEEAFNDLSIHIFLERNIDKVSPDFWAAREEPRYKNTDVEFLAAEQTDRIGAKNRGHRDEF